MTISSLVTGNAFQRPAISFSNKQTEYKLEKVSYLLNSKSSMADLGTAMSNLNTQLKKMQNISKDIIRSINSVLITITKLDKDMTNRFKRLNKEISDSRTEFTKSLAFITPSLTGGAGATINAAALGPAAAGAAGAAGSPAAKPSSGNSKWDAFMAFVEVTAPILFKKIGPKLLLMAGLAATGPAGWVVDALLFLTTIADAIELYQLWCQFTNQQPQQSAIDAAQATQNKQQTLLPSSPIFKAQQDQMNEAIKKGDYKAATAIALNRTEDDFPKQSSERGAAGGMTEPDGTSFKQLSNGQTGSPVKTFGAGLGMTEPDGTSFKQLSNGGGPKTFGAGLGMTEPTLDVQPQRRPKDLGKPTSAPAATNQQATPLIDPHAKSRAMFEAATEAERNGQSGTALFFAADKQRMLELENVKKAAAQPGAPVETKKAAAAPLPPRRPTIAFGAGLGMNEPQGTFGAGLGMNEPQEPSLAGLGGGETGMSDREVRSANMQNVSNNMQKEYDAKDRLAPIQDPMAEMARKMEEAKRIGALQDRQAIDDKDVADAAKYKPLEQNRAAIDSGAAKPATPTQALKSTIRNMQGPEATAEEPSSVGAPTAVPPKPTASPKITPEFEPGYSGKAGKILQYNLDQYNATQTSKGGEGNNVAGQNLPLTVKNPWIEEFIARQAISYQ